MRIADGVLYIVAHDTKEIIPVKWEDMIMIRKETDHSVSYFYKTGGKEIRQLIDETDTYSFVERELHMSSVCGQRVSDSITIPRHRIHDPRLRDLGLYAMVEASSKCWDLKLQGEISIKAMTDSCMSMLFLWQQKFDIERRTFYVETRAADWTRYLLCSAEVPVKYKARMLNVYIENKGFGASVPVIEKAIESSGAFALDFLSSGYAAKDKNPELFNLALDTIKKNRCLEAVMRIQLWDPNDTLPGLYIRYKRTSETGVRFGQLFSEMVNQDDPVYEVPLEETEEIVRKNITFALESGNPTDLAALYHKIPMLSRFVWWEPEGWQAKLEEKIIEKCGTNQILESIDCMYRYYPEKLDQVPELLNKALSRSKPRDYDQKTIVGIHAICCKDYKKHAKLRERLLSKLVDMLESNKDTMIKIFTINLLLQTDKVLAVDPKLAKRIVEIALQIDKQCESIGISYMLKGIYSLERLGETTFARNKFKALLKNLDFYSEPGFDSEKITHMLKDESVAKSNTMSGILEDELVKTGRFDQLRTFINLRVRKMFLPC